MTTRKLGAGGRVVDADQFDFDSEDPDLSVCVFVQPEEGLAVLVTKRRRNPDEHTCVDAAGVCQELAEMVVIGRLKLVFDQDDCSGAQL
jgi:hypothetical protein